MLYLNSFVPLLAAFGLGSILTALLQILVRDQLDKRKLRFEERKEAFIGLLDAYRKAASENSNDALKNFAYWHIRCDLVSSVAVQNLINELIESNDDLNRRTIAHEKLVKALRKDLGIH